MRARIVFGTVLALGLSTASSARADELRKVAPPGGGNDGLEVSVDLTAGVIKTRRCATADCTTPRGDAKSIPIGLDKSRADAKATTVEVLPIGEGKSVVRVRVPDVQRKDLAFEALLSAQNDEPIFSGLTGWTNGDDGDRSGKVVLVYDRDESSKFVLVADSREDTRICGQAATPLGARGLDPKSMQLRGATLHRLDKKARDGAERIVATVRPEGAKKPLGRVLLATGGSAPGATKLTDGDAESTWSEARPGDGHGEFATMRAPSELPIHGLVVNVAPSKPKADGAAPHTFFVATDKRLFQITMPEDAWSKPGASYEIALPDPVQTTCVALVLDEAYARGKAAPEVTLTEVLALTKFDRDGATLTDVAKALGTARSDEAAALLRRAGNDGLAAVLPVFDSLDAKGRALAVDVAASAGSCDGPAMDLVARALSDKETEVRRRALGRVERCGKAAGPALALAVRSDDEARRTAAAPLLAAVAPSLALEPLTEQMGKGSADTRRAMRSAFARAANSQGRDKLLTLLTRTDMNAAARLDLIRAMGAKLPELRPESDAAIAELLRGTPDMATRYLLAQPLAHLARAEGATSGELTRLAELGLHDPEWPVRARAVEVSSGIAHLLSMVVSAAADPEPRVREAALKAIANSNAAAGRQAATKALAGDEWTFVRTSAAEALGALAGVPDDGGTARALAAALDDASPKVRGAAILSLGKLHATELAPRVRERLDDTNEDTDVRVLAARTLGTMCVQNAADRLTKLAEFARSPVDENDDRLGMAAIEALGTLHPADLEKRLAPLRAKNARTPVRLAAERAIAEPGGCR